jgi:hypothetical protein
MADEPKDAPLEGENEIEIDGEKFDKDRALAKIKKGNSENASLRKRIADFEKAQQEAEDAKKDDLTKAQEASTSLQQQLDASTLENTRLRVALAKGLSEKQAARLVGSTREELEADADDFLADLAPAKKDDPDPVSGKPREKLPRGGGDPDDQVVETDPAKLAALIPR